MATSFSVAPAADNILVDGFDSLQTLNQNGNVYGIVIANGAGTPTNLDVKNARTSTVGVVGSEENTSGTALHGFNDSTNDQLVGQEVEGESTAIQIDSVEFELTRAGDISGKGDMYAEIWTMSGGEPNALVDNGISNPYSADNIGGSKTYHTFTFTDKPEIPASTSYAVIIRCDWALDDTNFPRAGRGGTYAGGAGGFRWNGTAWSTMTGDMNFKSNFHEITYGTPLDSDNVAATVAVENTLTFTGLDSETEYDVYVVGDGSTDGLMATVTKLDVLTAGPFKFTVRTTGSDETFTIPCQDVGTFNAIIDWGDGSDDSTITAYNDADLTHTYATADDYQISITGTFPNIYFNNGGDKLKVISVDDLGGVGWTRLNRSFYGCSNISSFSAATVNTSSVTDMNRMFYGLSSITTPPDVSGFDTASVMDMKYMFYGLSSITTPPDVSGFDTASVTDMGLMFYGLSSITTPPDVSGFDTASVTDMIYMFYGMSSASFDATQGVSAWDIGALTDADAMFSETSIATSEMDDIFINWESQVHQNNVTVDFGNSTYTAGGAAIARAALVTDGWLITDDGVIAASGVTELGTADLGSADLGGGNLGSAGL